LDWLTAYKDNIGKTAQISMGPFRVNMKILDACYRNGRLEYLVTPVSGEGKEWTSYRNVEGLWRNP
jgi:hypothetical protein